MRLKDAPATTACRLLAHLAAQGAVVQRRAAIWLHDAEQVGSRESTMNRNREVCARPLQCQVARPQQCFEPVSRNASALPGAHELEVVLGLLLVEENTRRDLEPGLCAARPDVGDWLEPARVIERARLERDDFR